MATQRAVLKGLQVQFGVISIQADLYSVQMSKAKRAKTNVATVSLCPMCDSGEPLSAKLWCQGGHGPFEKAEVRKAIETDEGSVLAVSADEVAAAKAPTVPERLAVLEVFPAVEVEAVTMPSGNLFRVRAESSPTYSLLAALVANRDHAFVCEMTLKGKTSWYRALFQGGTIVLAELIRPERMLESEPVELSSDERLVSQGAVLVETMLRPFEPDDWTDDRAVRLAALREAAPVMPSGATEFIEAGEVARSLQALLREADAA